MIKILNNFFLTFSNSFVAYCDAPRMWQMGPQDPATPTMEGMITFHETLMYYLVLIGIFVFYFLIVIIYRFRESKNAQPDLFVHSSTLEIIWTIIPACILLIIAVPSFSLLYSLDELVDPEMTLKIIGHQWYWTYEYSDYVQATGKHFVFDSYLDEAQTQTYKQTLRLLEVDNRVALPSYSHIRLLVTSSDVIHSWAVPSFGIKVDGTPGRLTQASLFIKRSGLYFGQCSEICGVNHAFMPIAVRVFPMSRYIPMIAYELNFQICNDDDLAMKIVNSWYYEQK